LLGLFLATRQMELSTEEEDVLRNYQESVKKGKMALVQGYSAKYIYWAAAYLRLHLSRFYFVRKDLSTSLNYLEKSEKKLLRLQQLCESSNDSLLNFSVCFNFCCVFATKSRIYKMLEKMTEALYQFKLAKQKIKKCAKIEEFKKYLTRDLLELWYLEEFQQKRWFKKLYQKSFEKKLSCNW